jgi:hypothetical protein
MKIALWSVAAIMASRILYSIASVTLTLGGVTPFAIMILAFLALIWAAIVGSLIAAIRRRARPQRANAIVLGGVEGTEVK